MNIVKKKADIWHVTIHSPHHLIVILISYLLIKVIVIQKLMILLSMVMKLVVDQFVFITKKFNKKCLKR